MITVDLDQGCISVEGGARKSPPGAALNPPLRLLAELELASDLNDACRADGLAVLNIEDLESLEDARSLISALERRFGSPLSVRFYDRDPRPDRSTASSGMRGARLIDDSELVQRFLDSVERLDLSSPPIAVLPMVSQVEEVVRFERMTGPLCEGVGATIETPAAALAASSLGRICRLVEIGLNDLTQLAIGWDRDLINDTLLPLRRVAPSVAELVRRACCELVGAEVDVSLGLDLCPSPALAEQLHGLGVEALSFPASLIDRWRWCLGQTGSDERIPST